MKGLVNDVIAMFYIVYNVLVVMQNNKIKVLTEVGLCCDTGHRWMMYFSE